MGVVAAVVAVAGTAYSISEQQKAGRRQERAQQVQQNQQLSEQRRANVRAERERRVRAARLRQSAENTGVGTSSGVTGALGGAQTTLASGIALGSQRANTARAVGTNLSEARSAQNKAQVGSAVAGLSTNIFESYGGFGELFSGTDNQINTPTQVG